jgi:hypothetical protein
MEINEDFAYWLGLVQADGFISNYKLKNSEHEIFEFGLETISEILAKEFSKGLMAFGRKCSVIKTKRSTYRCRTSVKEIIHELRSMNIKLREKEYLPVEKIRHSDSLFGAYLAGVIDGDGDVRIKRPAYPQCMIRVSSGSKQQELSDIIRNKMQCSVSERSRTATRHGSNMHWYELEFLVTSKNVMFIKNFLMPYIKLKYKKEKIGNFIETRW